MTVAGIAMVRDEADIIEATVRHMLGQVDFVIVMDNASIDGTREILGELGVGVYDNPDTRYFQSENMTLLSRMAAEGGADWVVPFDADEIWYSPFGTIKEVLEGIASQWLVATATMYDHVATGDDPAEDNPVRRICWRRRAPGGLPKVACRPRTDLVIEQGNHGATYVGGSTSVAGQLIVRHFPYRSAEQFVRKVRNGAAAYAATDLDESAGAHWRAYGRILDGHGEEALGDVFRQWFWVRFPELDPALIFDPVA